MLDRELPNPPKFITKKGVRDKLLFAISKGGSYQICCGFAGVSYSAFKVWMNKGAAVAILTDEEIDVHPDKCYYDLMKDVEEAESKAALRWLEKVEKAGEVHWQAAAWKLSKRYPDDYGNTDLKVKVLTEDNSLSKAKEEAARIQEEKHGRSTQAES